MFPGITLSLILKLFSKGRYVWVVRDMVGSLESDLFITAFSLQVSVSMKKEYVQAIGPWEVFSYYSSPDNVGCLMLCKPTPTIVPT